MLNFLFLNKYIFLEKNEDPINYRLEHKSYYFEPMVLNKHNFKIKKNNLITDNGFLTPNLEEKQYFKIKDESQGLIFSSN